MDIGTCAIHTIHESFKNAEKTSEWDIGKVFKSRSTILLDFPARRQTFEKTPESDLYPLPYCGHRWYESENCLYRAVEIWPSVHLLSIH